MADISLQTLYSNFINQLYAFMRRETADRAADLPDASIAFTCQLCVQLYHVGTLIEPRWTVWRVQDCPCCHCLQPS